MTQSWLSSPRCTIGWITIYKNPHAMLSWPTNGWQTQTTWKRIEWQALVSLPISSMEKLNVGMSIDVTTPALASTWPSATYRACLLLILRQANLAAPTSNLMDLLLSRRSSRNRSIRRCVVIYRTMAQEKSMIIIYI